MKINEVIREKRKELFLTQEQIAERLGAVSYTHLTLPTIGSRCRSRWSPYH